ncbi:TIGR02647 family protein [Aeromonas simiae]|uniref:TIGR02647 family protein n=1 Tax=Aeromonas simiae TaxID=218936 RepID=A0A5J6WW63_9GAMM|nr:TIGR02647 family protein [Aeromonas simiae]MDO2946846.1 TIGR02647 family protein [Aeromonas simiae]MDO2951353.1 TIGR02647 family protein [Aeromonas simiae]MDO2954560.1 TIGR02647 family protein [Aeromonas simiae]QFI55192.1 TIGR02647 family protein [Aeromonas simiae]
MSSIHQITPEFVSELKVLACYDPANLAQGIKLHKESPEEIHDAARRLHQRGLLEASDGGYLTAFGRTQVEHLQHLLTALRSE